MPRWRRSATAARRSPSAWRSARREGRSPGVAGREPGRDGGRHPRRPAAGGVAARWTVRAQAAGRLRELRARARYRLAGVGLRGRPMAVATCLSGVLPAVCASRVAPARPLRDGAAANIGGSRGQWVRTALVAQAAVALALVVLAGLLGQSVATARRFDVGFDRAGLVIARANVSALGHDEAQSYQYHAATMARVRALPGATQVTAASVVPLGPNDERRGVTIDGYTPPGDGAPLSMPNNVVWPGYFEVMGIPLVAGRGPAEVAQPRIRFVHVRRGRLDAEVHAGDDRAPEGPTVSRPRRTCRAWAARAPKSSTCSRATARWVAGGSSRCAATCRRAWAARRLPLRERAGRSSAASTTAGSTSRSPAIRRCIRRPTTRARPAQPQAQDRRRRERRDHAVLLQRRCVFPLRRRCAPARHHVPIVPGIMPISNFSAAQALLRRVRRGDPALDRQAHAGLRRRRGGDPRVRRRRGRRCASAWSKAARRACTSTR